MGSDYNGVLAPAAVLAAQSEIIDVIAAGADLRETLRRIALIVEQLTTPAICSILLIDPDGVHIRHGASPGLPDSYVAAIDGLPIGPSAGSCGAAAYSRRLVIVENIATDPLWADYRDLALAVGLMACWSQPVIDASGTVLGTFALYYREPRAPEAADLDLVDRMSRLVRVALAQDRREQALVETEQKLRDYLALSSDWVWEKMVNGRQFSVASSTVAIELEAAGRRSGTHLESVVRCIDAQIWAACPATVQAHQPIRNARASFERLNGETCHLNVSAVPVFDRNGQYSGYRGIAQDISRQVAAEAESHRLKLEAQDANQAKTEFLANISHELRTPLNAILGFSEIMGRELLGSLPGRYREYADDIHASGQHLNALVTDLLNLSRIEMGRLVLDDEDVAVNDLIADCLRMLEMRAAEVGVRLTGEPDPDAPLVRADRLRLSQALLNLVSNAVKFTPSLGKVTVASRSTAEGVALVVQDSGIGMKPEDIPRALEPFRQIDSRSDRSHGGVGLGLALAKSLIELHDGRLELSSAPGKGTTATIHLPSKRVITAGAG